MPLTLMKSFAAFCCLCFLAFAIGQSRAVAQVADSIELLGVASFAGDALDHSGLLQPMDDGTPNNCFGGISGLEYSPRQGTFIALSDRGARDGEVDWKCRFHTISLDFTNVSGGKIAASIQSTVMLRDWMERPFVGLATQYAADKEHGDRFDPEGVRILPNGNLLVSDEYGPHLIEFTPAGNEVRRIPLPEKLLARNLDAEKGVENKKNTRGRVCNRGMEGIAITPDGNFVVALMQSPLLQDAIRIEKGKLLGFHTRVLKINLETGEHQEFVYVMDHPKHKLHEILPISNDEFLVLENCGEAGAEATCKIVTRIDLRGATDVSQYERLPALNLSHYTKPVSKSVLLDLLEPQYELSQTLPEKIEGLSFGPNVNGQPTLVIAADNDFVLEEATKVYVFQIRGMQTASIH